MPYADPMVGTKAPPSLLYMVKQVELVVRSRLDELVKPAGITALRIVVDMGYLSVRRR